jgi:hypothetical protein
MVKRFGLILTVIMVAMFMVAGSVMAAPVVDGTMLTTPGEWAGIQTAEDGTGPGGYVGPGYGGQAYDVEYLGLYVDATTVYFGLQTGFDLVNGVSSYSPGDFGLDVTGDGNYEYAIDYSIDGSGNVTYTLVDMSSATATWSMVAIPGYSESNPWEAVYQSSDILQTWLSTTGSPYDAAYGSGVYLNNIDGGISYVLEGSFALNDLAGASPMTIHWTMECGNDYLNHTVPIPTTMLLLGTGLMGLVGFGRKRLLNK